MTATIPEKTSPPEDAKQDNALDLPEQESANVPDPLAPTKEAPYGYRIDGDGNKVPKKTAGRPKGSGRNAQVTPPPERSEPIQRGKDIAPDKDSKGSPAEVPYQKGVIRTGMTKLYKRTGRIVKSMDADIGIAIVESAEECGEAWEDLAKANPRVRALLMKLLRGSGWSAIFMAHMPIFMAVMMKERIRKHIPILNVMEFITEDEDISEATGGMQMGDLQQMAAMAQNLMPELFNNNGNVPDGKTD